TIDNGITLSTPVVSIRYQYDNHLGSASLELDQNAAIISYEEYHPFGTTSYRSGRTETEVAMKRYKYVGKERDEETGLYYYGARYYAAWIARFVSVDPLQLKYPHYTPYQYAGNKPVSYIDLDGLEEAKTTEEKKPEERQSESITPMQSKNADLIEVPKENVDMSLRKIPELSFNTKYIGLRFASVAEAEEYDEFKSMVTNRAKGNSSNKYMYQEVLKELTAVESNTEIVFRLRMGENITCDAGGGNNKYNPKNMEIDINIVTSGSFTITQTIAHEFKHAFQFTEGKLGYGFAIGPYTHDFADEYEAYQRQNLFSDYNKNNFLSDDQIIEKIESDYNFDFSFKNITVSDFFKDPKALTIQQIKLMNEKYINIDRKDRLNIFKGWKSQ
ncbi:MAG TPA: hypothetical protein DF296_04645, partial [Candidatus Margulisbacteria bacterium]|nr:hypothetical protein [Candidatus Margulisiibacteriota bacterium]